MIITDKLLDNLEKIKSFYWDEKYLPIIDDIKKIIEEVSEKIYNYDLKLNFNPGYTKMHCKIYLKDNFLITINSGVSDITNVSISYDPNYEFQNYSNEPDWMYWFTIYDPKYGWSVYQNGFTQSIFDTVDSEYVIRSIIENSSIEKYIKDRNEYIEKIK